MQHNLINSIECWDKNSQVWDEAMGDGSLFQKTIVQPDTLKLLNIQPNQVVLDLACGNGQMSRALAKLGVKVIAIDGSPQMIKFAEQRSQELNIHYHVKDITRADELKFLDDARFDAVLCNMALMDIEEINPVFQLAYRVLKEKGIFVFSITHPCFDKSVGTHVTEVYEKDGTIMNKRSIKVGQYLKPQAIQARALPTFPSTHYFYHRSLQTYLTVAFDVGFVLTGIVEPAFPQDATFTEHKGWHELSEIPVVFIAQLKKYEQLN